MPPAERARNTRRPARPGPRGPCRTRGQLRGPGRHQTVGGGKATGAATGTRSGAKESEGAHPHPTSNKSKSPQGTRWRDCRAGTGRSRPLVGTSRPRLAAVGPPGTARLRQEKAGARPPRRPPRDGPRLRPAPPPAGTPPARARSGVFAPLLSTGGAGSAPGRTVKLGTAGAAQRPDAGWCTGGVLICLGEREDCSEAQQQLHACVPRRGWELAVGSGPGAATSRKGRDLACGGAGFEVLPGGFRAWVLRPIRRSLRGKGKRTFFFIFFLLYLFLGRRLNSETWKQLVRIQAKLVNDGRAPSQAKEKGLSG